MTDRDDLPEGVIDADPPGAWESADSADAETAERNAESIQSPDLTDAGLPPNAPQGEDATGDKPAHHPDNPVDPSEGSDSRDETSDGEHS